MEAEQPAERDALLHDLRGGAVWMDEWRPYPAEANMAPKGYRLAWNGKSRFGGEYRAKWVRDPRQSAYWDHIEQAGEGTDEEKAIV